jgi:hypothetical protein
VPDDNLLPPESLRWFQVDPRWMDCLVAGGASVGYIPDGNRRPAIPAWSCGGRRDVSGVLLRSGVVSGWPSIRIEAYGVMPGGDLAAQPMPAAPLMCSDAKDCLIPCCWSCSPA